MDIYILRDEREIGPFSEEATHSLLNAGKIASNDLAWTPGITAWTPLTELLQPGSAVAAPPKPEPIATEPATAKQKAILSYLGIAFTPGIGKSRAAILVTEAMEDPKLSARVRQWTDDRLKLHPELFAEEIQEKKNNRANVFFDLCKKEGADRFTEVTKAHCQVLIGFLDVQFPNWDANEDSALSDYFFPAVAEKFPQLVQKAWREKLKYPESPKLAPELVAPPAPEIVPVGDPPIWAMLRGLVWGLAILLVLYVGQQALRSDTPRPTPADAPPAPAPVEFKPAPPHPGGSPAAAAKQETPSAPSSKPKEAPAEMAASTPPTEPTMDDPPPTDPAPAPAPAPKVFLVITKPTEVQLPFGRAKLTVGMQLKIISQDGANVKAVYGGSVVTISIDATDLAGPAMPLPAQ